MGKIKKILENELIGGTQNTDIYPVTSTRAVFDRNNDNLDDRLANKIPENADYNDSNSDLSISDEKGNIIISAQNGHIKTKNFDSSNTAKKPYTRVTRFTVNVDCGLTNGTNFTPVNINSYTEKKIYSDNVVLYLPTSYTVDKEATKLIILCKQGSTQVTSYSDPVFNLNIFNYMLYLGYAILAADGMPDGLTSELGLDDTRVVGNYVAVQSVIRAYHKIISEYNIDNRGCFVFGFSQGGHYAQNVVDLSGIPILACAELSPVCSMRYHQWDLSANRTIGGIDWTRPARLNIARLFGFTSVTNNEELLSLPYDQDKVQGYDPWTRGVKNPYTGFVQGSSYGSNLWKLPDNVNIKDISMTKLLKAPLKIWVAENDSSLGADVTKVFVQAAKNAGQEVDLVVYSSGGHGIHYSQNAIGTFTENNEVKSLYPIAYEIALWYYRFGGYELK